MQFCAEQIVDLVDAQQRQIGRIRFEREEDDLLIGAFTPGADYASVELLFYKFEEAVDSQALSLIDALDADIAALGLHLRCPDTPERLAVRDVQIWRDGSFTCRECREEVKRRASALESLLRRNPVVQIAPSILAADFARLADEVARVEAAGASLLHVDVMDGHFVPNLTIGPPVVQALHEVTDLPLDVHLMVEEPDALLPAFIEAGSAILSVHVEACRHLHRTIQAIKAAGVKASVVLNPASPVSLLHDILPDLDMVLLMSVNPGFGGQSFIPSTLDKIRLLKEMIEARGLDVRIEVDGGVKPDNARQIREAGADILVAGTAVFGQEDYAAAISALQN